MRKVFVVCILICCMTETCVSLAGKLLVPVTGLPKLLSLFPFDSDICYRKPRNQLLRSRCLKLAFSNWPVSRGVSDTEVSPDNFSITPSLEASLEKSDCIPSGYMDSSVLLVGDGDFSFAAALSSLKICRSLLATTWDSKERLIKSFPRAAENIRIMEENGDTIQYEVDATDLQATISSDYLFDTIAWNFPHIAGKQNIKRNRELIQNFLVSSFSFLNSKGSQGKGTVKIALCDGQSGTKALSMDDWNFSWKLVHQAAEADCLLTDIEDFPLQSFPGYKVTGHRGHGGDFPTGTAPQYFSFKRSAPDTSPDLSRVAGASSEDTTESAKDSIGLEDVDKMYYEALQAPSYIHEVHLLAVTMVSDLMALERRAREGVKLLIAQFEDEEERERIRGGAERVDALNRIRLGKQLVPVRRRYRTQQDRDEQTLAKLAISAISFSDGDKSSDSSDSASDSIADSDGIDVSIISDKDPAECTDREICRESWVDLRDVPASSRHNSSVWAVNLVDVYTCPRTQQISHAFQVTYCSLTRPIGRTVADRYRERIEKYLPIYLGMVPRVVKHGGLVSLSYPWYVTSAVRTILASSSSSSSQEFKNTEGRSEESAMASEVDVTDLAIILRELERQERALLSSDSTGDLSGVPVSASADITSLDQLDGREKIRTIARSLWRKRVGVLMQGDFQPTSVSPPAPNV